MTENDRTGADGSTCRELTEFLDDYLAGDLGTEVRTRFEAHLVECRDCLAYLHDYRETVRLVREAGRDVAAEAPPEVPPELLRAIRDARKAGR